MTFTRRTLLLSAVPFAMAAVISIITMIMSGVIADRSAEIQAAEQIRSNMQKLIFLTDRYVITRYPPLQAQWIDIYSSTGQFLNRAVPTRREEEPLLENMKRTHASIGRLFNRLVDNEKAAEGGGASTERLRRQLDQRLTDALMVKTRAANSDAARLETFEFQTMERIRVKVLYLTIFALFGTAFVVTAVLHAGLQPTVAAMKTLLEGTLAAATGNFDYRVHITTGDELQQLADSFNAMMEQLKKKSLYVETSMKAMEVENQLYRRSEERLTAENREKQRAEEALTKLNRDLERRVAERTAELQHANRLLEKMREHADRETYQARLLAVAHQEHHRKLERLLHESGRIFMAGTVGEVLNVITDIAREIVGARYAIIGHRFIDGHIQWSGMSLEPGSKGCGVPEGLEERGGVYRDVLEKGQSIVMTDQELRNHPAWWGLPDRHLQLRGLLCVPVMGHEPEPIGMIMVSDRLDGKEFTQEDRMLLAQLAALTSMAMRCGALKL